MGESTVLYGDIFPTPSDVGAGHSRRPLVRAQAGNVSDRKLSNAAFTPAGRSYWFTADDLAYYVGEFARTGFRGGLSWYRSADATWELTRGFDDVRIRQPALFVTGERGPVLAMMRGSRCDDGDRARCADRGRRRRPVPLWRLRADHLDELYADLLTRGGHTGAALAPKAV